LELGHIDFLYKSIHTQRLQVDSVASVPPPQKDFVESYLAYCTPSHTCSSDELVFPV
jgi:hypothetical protein